MQHGQIFELKTTGPGGQGAWPTGTASTDVDRDESNAAGTPALTTRATRSSGR